MAVFLTDALSLLQPLTNKRMPHLAKTLQLFSNNCRVALQWILARKGKQPDANVSYQEQATTTTYDAKSREGCLTLLVGQSKW